MIRIICILLPGFVTGPQLSAQPPKVTGSDYVQRMLSLDRDADGFLARNELPGKLSELLKHDANGDQKLDATELADVERKALAARDKGSPAVTVRNPAGRRGKRGRATTGTGSPLDPQQILRFALTFDADKDGGLNAAELNRYAHALAARRAQGRRQGADLPEDDDAAGDVRGNSTAPKGLGDPSTQDDTSPFGPPPGKK